MNLKKCFQPKYMYQNIKKSKAIITILLFLFPLIMSLLQLTSAQDGVINILKNNGIMILTAFIIPITLSIILFSFVYKKKKVDFMIGMPISRKQIFITNTICGIILIFTMFLINIFFLFLFSYFNQNVILSISMVLDYFVVYFTSYIFIFVVSNVAMSLAGNIITQIILILLITFFIPFTTVFHQGMLSQKPRLVELSCRSEKCKQIKYEDCEKLTEVKNCKQQAASGYYYTDLTKIYKASFALPTQNIISKVLINSENIYSKDSIIRTLIISIIMFGIGIFTFQKRKMEQCETSFTNFHIHSIVKSLTLLPFVLILVIMKTNIMDSIIVLLIFLAYFYMYDLITKRKIHYVFKSLAYFITLVVICFTYCYGMDYYLKSKERKGLNYIKEELNISKIKGFKISMNADDLGLPLGYYVDDIVFEGKDQIYTLLQHAFKAESNHSNANSFSYQLILNNKQSYNGFMYLDNKEVESLSKSLKQSKEIEKITQLKESNLLNVIFLGKSYSKEDIKPILKDVLNNTFKPIQENAYKTNSQILDITAYIDHKVITLAMPLTNDSKILEYMLKLNNEKTKDGLKTKDIYYINNYDKDSYTNDKKVIYEMEQWILKDKTVVDSSKEYYAVNLYVTRSNESYTYITNNKEILNFFEQSIQENDRGETFDM